MSTAPRPRPTIVPITTPDIQTLLFDDESTVDVCSVACGVTVLEEAMLVEVVATLEDVGVAEVAPTKAFSTMSLGRGCSQTHWC